MIAWHVYYNSDDAIRLFVENILELITDLSSLFIFCRCFCSLYFSLFNSMTFLRWGGFSKSNPNSHPPTHVWIRPLSWDILRFDVGAGQEITKVLLPTRKFENSFPDLPSIVSKEKGGKKGSQKSKQQQRAQSWQEYVRRKQERRTEKMIIVCSQE